jgi:hypothetical protein
MLMEDHCFDRMKACPNDVPPDFAVCKKTIVSFATAAVSRVNSMAR